MIDPNPHKRIVDQPQAGFFKMALVRRGWKVPCKIEQLEDGRWQATINGDVQFPAHTDPVKASGVLDVWHHGTFISEGDYVYLLEVKVYAQRTQRDHPAANPAKPIDFRTMPPVYQPKEAA